MTEKEVLDRFRSDIPALRAWSHFVVYVVLRRLRSALGSREAVEAFLKIPATSRLKGEDSLVYKALYRGKTYDDPYEDITDRVGVRFVVLLLRDVDRIKEVIEGYAGWSCSRDRDFEEERQLRPYEFNYQAVHYVLRPRATVSACGASIHQRIPCEVQVKTLLQHAYAELTHDLVYKPRTAADPTVLHEAAKSMALAETADDLFMSANSKFESAGRQHSELYRGLSEIYQRMCGLADQADERFNILLIEELSKVVGDVRAHDVETLLANEGVSPDCIKQRHQGDFLFRQPVVLLLMLLVRQREAQLREHWPFPPRLLQGVYTALGMSASGCL
ncbi:hypothetical protein FJY68_08135 [candidate division WOR-3 bacterium]|uniref:RelA/SpoT domain-containing protein n=1 Tax=candidate division WOR-3 bacterium TaxID=2052148 RepID=A0A937XE91_UNCW3|nr:hypothetical protein [candidate division WOR-3 bacterium]